LVEQFKPIVWMGDARNRVRAFSMLARQEVGFQLDRVQHGLEPRDYRYIPSVGPGVTEVRVHAANEYRVFYVARLKPAIYVLHVFVKKTRRTSAADVALAKKRYRELLREEDAE
jgi:phage-related protein